MFIFLTAGPLLDALTNQAERERAELYTQQVDQALSEAAVTSDTQELSVPPDAEVSVIDDGKIEVVWYDHTETDDDPPWNDSGDCSAPTVADGTLGALEFELDETTIVHQGGGIWEHTDEYTRVSSEPNIAYTNASGDETGSLQFNIMQLEEGDIGGSELSARANHSKSTALTDEIQEAARDCGGGDVAFLIESSYHEGWAAFLEDALGADENPEVTVTHDEDEEEVVATIEGIRESFDRPTFVVADDGGLKEPGVGGDPIEPPVLASTESNNPGDFRIAGVIENVGDKKDSQNVGITIWDDEGEQNESTELTLQPDDDPQDISEPGNDHVHFQLANLELTAGETYEYTIWTRDDQLDDPGSFYYGEPGTHLEIDSLETDEDGENVTVTADVSNIGVENATDTDVTFELLGETATEEIDADYGAEGTVEWEVNTSTVPVGEHEFTIDTGDDEVDGTIEGDATDDDRRAFVVVGDEGAGDDQFVTDDGSPFNVSAEVESTYLTTVERDVTLSIPDADVSISEPKELENGTTDTVDFDVDPDNHDYDFDHGEVYEYDVQAEGDGLDPNGSFYFGHSDTQFELANGNATLDDENVTLTADLHNTGVVNGTGDDAQNITVDLETDDLPDDLDEDPYAETIDAGTADRAVGENATIELPINRSVLVTGTYDATIATDDDELEMTFDVDTGIDPGDVELGGVEDANVTVEVLGSQVSGPGQIGFPPFFGEYTHNLAPMTLDIVANGETVHSFDNPEGGNNINIGPTWQDKSADSYTYNFTVEDETDLTLRNARYGTCQDRQTDPNNLNHYDGPTDHEFTWCEDVSGSPVFGPIDASEDANLQNVRVRSNESSTIPALPAGTEQQLSATEVLEQHDLVEEGDDELDLGPGEFVFLFENTISCDHPDVDCDEDDGIDALWNNAIDAYEENPDETYDPNFNDLIVYVEVEQAGVDPGTPRITISPGSGDEADVDPGDGDDPGTPGDPDLELGGGAEDGDSPDVGVGDSDQSGASGGQVTDDTGIHIGSDHIVIG